MLASYQFSSGWIVKSLVGYTFSYQISSFSIKGLEDFISVNKGIWACTAGQTEEQSSEKVS